MSVPYLTATSVTFTQEPCLHTQADTIALALQDGEGLPTQAPDELSELLRSNEARSSFKSLALGHAQGKRWLLVGLGDRSELSAERLRVAAALVSERARELHTRTLCWALPNSAGGAQDDIAQADAAQADVPQADVPQADVPQDDVAQADVPQRADVPQDDVAQAEAASGASAPSSVLPRARVGAPFCDARAFAAALVEGTMLADYRFETFKSDRASKEPKAAGNDPGEARLEELIVSHPQDVQQAVSRAALITEEVNRARDLQNRPGNDLTPTALSEHALALAAEIDGLSVEVEGRQGLINRAMGAFAAVAQGSEQEPALITARYRPRQGPRAGTPILALVGKAVTFDSGGISLKPGAKMAEMKFDMSGGAAALHAIAAIARLALPIEAIAVLGATENMPSGRSVKPGDIVTASNGVTIEVNNTDAEGRLVLADCLAHAVSLGAERIVDLATLTGAVIVALGSTYAGLVSNDDELAARVTAAGQRSGEIVWRLPLHEEYDELIKGAYADINNAPEARKAGTIIAASFLSHFVGQTPWAHLDIAGSAWDLGRAYAPAHAAGYGVRLLVELARDLCE